MRSRSLTSVGQNNNQLTFGTTGRVAQCPFQVYSHHISRLYSGCSSLGVVTLTSLVRERSDSAPTLSGSTIAR